MKWRSEEWEISVEGWNGPVARSYRSPKSKKKRSEEERKERKEKRRRRAEENGSIPVELPLDVDTDGAPDPAATQSAVDGKIFDCSKPCMSIPRVTESLSLAASIQSELLQMVQDWSLASQDSGVYLQPRLQRPSGVIPTFLSTIQEAYKEPKEMEPSVEMNFRSDTLSLATEAAFSRLHKKIIETPMIRLPWLDTANRMVWAKLEFQQHSGSFKYRGALNALSQCPNDNIITASAGNHALAVAAAGLRLGKKIEVIAPTTASEIKMRRLASDTSVTVVGKDLYEAVCAAKRRVVESDTALHFLSPYADFDVVAGAGTIACEIQNQLEQPPDMIVVPLGGGGLAAGIGARCKIHLPNTEVVCTHPAIFGRTFSDRTSISQQLMIPIEASLSDGLAVQLSEPTPCAAILDDTVKRVVQVSEAETLTAIAALLRMQSSLVEGSAATTVASLLADPHGQRFRGTVVLLLTGGNVAPAVIARALVTEIPDSKNRDTFGLRHILGPIEKHGALKAYHHTSASPSNESLSVQEIFLRLTKGLRDAIVELERKAIRKTELDKRLALSTDAWCNGMFLDLNGIMQDLLAEFEDKLHADVPLAPWEMEDRYRNLLNFQSLLASMFERASAAYDQSMCSWYFDTSTQNTNAVNYDRYGTVGLRALEIQLLDTLRLGTSEPFDLLLTSSGMAAFQVILLYLLQTLQPGDAIVVSPYIYFEALEQLQAMQYFQLVHAPDFTAESIIATAEKHNAKVVLFDAVANTVDLPTTDVRSLLQSVGKRSSWSQRTIVIDGSMTSGGMQVFDWVQGPNKPTLLYYESVSKYLSLGLDLQMAGLIAYPSHLDERLRTIRRNSGSIMYTRSTTLVPALTYEIFQSRMRILNRNAETFSQKVAAAISSIALVRHAQEWRAYGWRHGGSLCTIRFYRDGMNNKEGLEACIDLILRAAEKLRVPFVKGLSFGFSTFRISAASSMAQNMDPFLRINVGIEHETALCSAADAVVKGVLAYADRMGGAGAESNERLQNLDDHANL